jgi:hypothetical protein
MHVCHHWLLLLVRGLAAATRCSCRPAGLTMGVPVPQLRAGEEGVSCCEAGAHHDLQQAHGQVNKCL